MIGNIVKKIDEAYESRMNNIISLENQRYDQNLVAPYLSESSKLTSEEKNQIKQKWGGG